MNKNIVILIAAIVISAIIGALTSVVAIMGLDTNTVVMTPAKDNPANITEGKQQIVIKGDNPDLTYAAESAVKSVVHIEALVEVRYASHIDPWMEFFGYGPQPDSTYALSGGSGVIISEDGYIVTNNHVIENAEHLRVSLYDGRAFEAEIIGTDPDTDIALIKIDAEELEVMPFGSSDDLRLGEWVLAIGYPMELQTTVTAGIVSAKARHLGAIGTRSGIESFIQTDAAVNPGNSGGALVNTQGELVGINTIIKTSTGSYVGYSFAVPETIVQKVVTDLREYGVVHRAVLGISFEEINQAFIDKHGKREGIYDIGGIFITNIAKGGAAHQANLKAGDIITHFNGTEISDTAHLLEQIGQHRPGDVVTLKILREGKEYDVEVTLLDRHGRTTPTKIGRK